MYGVNLMQTICDGKKKQTTAPQVNLEGYWLCDVCTELWYNTLLVCVLSFKKIMIAYMTFFGCRVWTCLFP